MAWGDRIVTPPTGRVVSLQEVKDFLRIDGEESDSEIARLITVATERAQNLTRRQLLTATRKIFFECWPAEGTIYLPWAPLQSVTAVTYLDTAELTQTFSSTKYRVDIDAEPGRLMRLTSAAWPDIFTRYGAVMVEYVCGYGATSASVPEPLRHAVLMMVGHYFDNRGEVTKGAAAEIVPSGVQHLLEQYIVGDEFHRYGQSPMWVN